MQKEYAMDVLRIDFPSELVAWIDRNTLARMRSAAKQDILVADSHEFPVKLAIAAMHERFTTESVTPDAVEIVGKWAYGPDKRTGLYWLSLAHVKQWTYELPHHVQHWLDRRACRRSEDMPAEALSFTLERGRT